MNINEVNAIGVKFSKDADEQVYVNLHDTTTAYGITYYRFVKMVPNPSVFDLWAISQKYLDEQVEKGMIRIIQTFKELVG